MNAHDKSLNNGDLAVVHYGDGEMTVVRPGRYVLCAVSGRKIPLENLRYWNATVQEAYAGPEEAQARWKQLNAAT